MIIETMEQALSNLNLCREANMKAHAELDRLRAKVAKWKWQPIATAPKDGTAILITNGKTFSACQRVAYWDDEAEEPYKWHVEDAAKGFNHHKDWPTHWMPLPAPPKETEG